MSERESLGVGRNREDGDVVSDTSIAANLNQGEWDWFHSATVEELREHLDAIGPPWGNSKLLASAVIDGFWIAFEALDRLEARSRA